MAFVAYAVLLRSPREERRRLRRATVQVALLPVPLRVQTQKLRGVE